MDPQFSKVLERWVIEPQDLELGEVLGRGGFGVVSAGTWRDGESKVQVAVKQIPMLHKEVPTQDWQKLLQEAAVMAKASERCKFSCRLFGICLMPDHICLVMKRYVTSLDNKLKKFPDRKAPQADVDQWMLDICQGVVEMHNQNIIFRDLKPSNVLLDEFGGAILADFGIARIVENTLASLRTTTSAGTASYMAPEMFDPELGPVTKKSDIWALACLLLELQTGKVPWEGLNILQIMSKVCVKKSSPPIPSGLGHELVEVLQKCFAFEPSERPSAIEVLEAVKREVGTSMAIEDQFSANLESLTWLSSTDGSTNYSTSKSNPFTTRELGQGSSSNVISPHTSSYIENCDGNVDTRESNASSQPHTGTSFTQEYDGNCDLGSSNNSIKPTVTEQSLAEDHDDFNIVHIGTLVEEHTGHQGTLYCGSKDGTIDVWDSNLRFMAQLSGNPGFPVDLLAIDHNDTLFSSSSAKHKGVPDRTVWVWRNQVNVTILAITVPVRSLACAPTGMLYVGTAEGKIKVYNDLEYITEYNCGVRTMAVQEDVLFIEASSTSVMNIQAWRNHKCIAQGNRSGANSHVEQLRCSTTRDGTYLYSASNHGSIVVSRSNVDVWKVESKN
ncbi:hypothetical protein CY35_17G097000 [Sphagnum magellanicum]|nr:hypothetical protein CY35_17G097000 [Sphagnum magellanicum]KAH9536218.1 hypothetical protein CY35_17G097000 [Sphagnum magellanicum]